jgi:putative tryptophan/tyrosine transport system substrate-binding protein
MLLLGGAITGARVVRAQQKAMPVIGFLASTSRRPAEPSVPAFREGLSETGYVEGQNVAIEYRWAEERYDRLPALAADLAGRHVDVIAAIAIPAALAAKNATATIPIVFAIGVDPVEVGLVTSLARPGGNVTGVTFMNVELMAKRLELLSELVPQTEAIALLVNPNFPQTERIIRDVQEAARTKNVRLDILKASTESEIDAAFASLVQLHAGALIVSNDPVFFDQRDQLLTLASRHVVPTIYAWREFTEAGGLISYGTNRTSSYRLAAIYVGKILKGKTPADLPVQQPTTFEQSKDREGTRPDRAALDPRPRRRGDRVTPFHPLLPVPAR